jgi:hypothetical protein
MAATHTYKIFTADNNYIAAAKWAEDAVAIVVLIAHEGGTVRNGHSKKDILWTEGQEEFSGAESYDHAGEVIEARQKKRLDGILGGYRR